MTTHFRVLRALAVSAALWAPGASIALADSPANLQAGSPAVAVVPNNGLCSARYGVPMADCDRPDAAQHAKAGAAGSTDYQGFPYNLSSGD